MRRRTAPCQSASCPSQSLGSLATRPPGGGRWRASFGTGTPAAGARLRAPRDGPLGWRPQPERTTEGQARSKERRRRACARERAHSRGRECAHENRESQGGAAGVRIGHLTGTTSKGERRATVIEEMGLQSRPPAAPPVSTRTRAVLRLRRSTKPSDEHPRARYGIRLERGAPRLPCPGSRCARATESSATGRVASGAGPAPTDRDTVESSVNKKFMYVTPVQ